MRIGQRWQVGATPPDALPLAVLAAVRGVEADLGAASTGWGWTLTWLEGSPVVELDDGTLIEYRPAEDRAVVRFDDDDDVEDEAAVALD